MKSPGEELVRLVSFGTEPRYNIKAVVQATGIRPSTLRAWERRYHMMQPHRSASGYRLYSDQDVAVIRWLKDQVDSGMSISQAVSWLESERLETGKQQSKQPLSPPLPGMSANSTAPQSDGAQPTAARSFAALQDELLFVLSEYDDVGADRVLSEAFSIYPIEVVGEELIRPVLVEIGERWHRQELSIVKEHYATNFLLQRMTSLLRGARPTSGGPVIWVGCAPNERHEVGAVLLAINLRRAGYAVRYLGQDLPVSDMIAEAERERPWMILLSASTPVGAEGVRAVSSAFADKPNAPFVGYGGSIFRNQPSLHERQTAHWMGETAQQATQRVAEIMQGTGRA